MLIVLTTEGKYWIRVAFFWACELRINRIMNSRKAYMGVHRTDQYLQPLLTLNIDPEVRSSQVCYNIPLERIDLKKAYSAVNLARENSPHFSTTLVSPRNDLIRISFRE